MARVAVVGLHGKLESGKDTVADLIEDLLVENTEVTLHRVAVADRLKDSVAAMIGIPRRELDELSKRDVVYGSRTLRTLLQEVGGFMRSLDSEFWMRAVRQRYLELQTYAAKYESIPSLQLMLLTDLRYENEAAFVREAGGIVVHVIRPTDTPPDAHESERGIVMRAADYVLPNQFDLQELRALVAEMITRTGLDAVGPLPTR